MGKLLALVGAYVKANVAMALEYRGSLISQVAGMFINNLLWIGFWILYFTKFPVLRGWTLEDVIVLWATLALSWGLVTGPFSNVGRIPSLVVQGQLDYYLALPKNVLLHLMISQIRLTSVGDLLFGLVVFFVKVDLTWGKVAVFLGASLLAAMVWLGIFLLTGSLTFFVGNAETAGGQIVSAVLHFASYPTPIFSDGVKMLLFTLLPAGFISTLPVELVREFHWQPFMQLLGGAVLFVGAGVWLFHRGLRRYESGSLMMMRS